MSPRAANTNVHRHYTLRKQARLVHSSVKIKLICINYLVLLGRWWSIFNY